MDSREFIGYLRSRCTEELDCGGHGFRYFTTEDGYVSSRYIIFHKKGEGNVFISVLYERDPTDYLSCDGLHELLDHRGTFEFREDGGFSFESTALELPGEYRSREGSFSSLTRQIEILEDEMREGSVQKS
jgi:hypothetical protein